MRKPIQQALAGLCAKLRVLIRPAGPAGSGEGKMVVTNGIAADHQRLTAAHHE